MVGSACLLPMLTCLVYILLFYKEDKKICRVDHRIGSRFEKYIIMHIMGSKIIRQSK